MLRPLYSTSIIIFFNVIHYYNLLKLIKITDQISIGKEVWYMCICDTVMISIYTYSN